VRGFFAERNNLLVSLASLLVLPLCMLRSFAALTYTSMLGVMGVLYTAAFMTFRWLSGSYAPGGEMFDAIRTKPEFGGRFQPIKTLILVATLNTAYHAHYDAPKFYHIMGSMQAGTPPAAARVCAARGPARRGVTGQRGGAGFRQARLHGLPRRRGGVVPLHDRGVPHLRRQLRWPDPQLVCQGAPLPVRRSSREPGSLGAGERTTASRPACWLTRLPLSRLAER
jgi:hypothetical protein